MRFIHVPSFHLLIFTTTFLSLILVITCTRESVNLIWCFSSSDAALCKTPMTPKSLLNSCLALSVFGDSCYQVSRINITIKIWGMGSSGIALCHMLKYAGVKFKFNAPFTCSLIRTNQQTRLTLIFMTRRAKTL